MPAHDIRNRLTHPAHQPRVLQNPNGRVRLGVDVLELVVAVEAGAPAERGELVDEAGVDEVDGALVDACFRLAAAVGFVISKCELERIAGVDGETDLKGQPTICARMEVESGRDATRRGCVVALTAAVLGLFKNL